MEGRISVFDHGAVPLMKSGKIGVRRARLVGLARKGARLSDDQLLEVDAVVLATGFEPRFEEFVGEPARFLERGQDGKGVSPSCLTPLTDGFDRSSIDPSLFFVGVDHKVNGGTAMGMQGWSCGYRIAQQLGLLPAAAPFSLDALPERQRDVIAERHRRRARRAWGGLAVVACAAAAGLALAHGRGRAT
eukprot:1549502-Prymnesium_polylepis.1